VGRYGSRAAEVLRRIAALPELGRPLGPGVPAVRAEARFAAETEMAIRVDDVLRRRTQVALRTPHGGADAVEDVAALMAAPLDWDRATVLRKAAEAAANGAGGPEPRRREA
jgi:glycerol-3-phosphate dehydrogenase